MVVLFLTDCDDCLKMVNFARSSNRNTDRGIPGSGAAVNDKAAYLVTPYIQRYRPSFPIGYLTADGPDQTTGLGA